MNIEISALFSTYNRAPLLYPALDALTRQTLPTELFEVIIVDDGSTDNTREVVAVFEKSLNIKYLFQEHKGLAAGKNLAITQASAPIILFMDDDDVPDPDLLTQHLISHRQCNEHTAVLGYTRISPELRDDPLMHFVTEVNHYLFSYPQLSHGSFYDYTHFWGGRSSCKTSLVREHGYFDEIFTFGCEDIELGYRLSRALPFRVLYNKRAVSTMIRRIDIDAFMRRVYRQGVANALFYTKHPTPEILSWTQLQDWPAHWENTKSSINHLHRAARKLDRLVRIRREVGLGDDDGILLLLYQSYRDAFDASRLKGSADQLLLPHHADNE
jgi:glycosyltransferase involved in cell wall biosynthesis